ncbi:protein-methionine-sulfoxide reductase catalytic subunit MsrP [Teredinibacter haidensis]|uniref:protein-methionine-sulfoxide reductase catalytic subunit MsrP n=1 Tax=Teredinibacter haidensis TaxID=2731755 RepID=UPI0009490A24|nr:protein-methionine-sulfoxide reductase catalytic subunit MsrP [Teredinibacter haidensis]
MPKLRWPLIPQYRHYGLTENDVTSEQLYLSRRNFIGLSASSAIGLASYLPQLAQAKASELQQKLTVAKRTHTHPEPLTPYNDITQYNNFYELGTAKTDPVERASALQTTPWSIAVEGECAKPGHFTLEQILAGHELEERIYKLRCVEAWSMVIPWTGFPLADLLKRFEPTSDAKYVAFETLYNADLPLPGQKRKTIAWPYREGLRMDEAMHPLSFMAVGLYGKSLPNQNGAPIRLVVPWKYGFKSIKSIVKIRFTKTEPQTSWNMIAPEEYGFYSNVNPNANHPRWSQKRERRIGELFKVKTEMFNGYEADVAQLYNGMNLKTFY